MTITLRQWYLISMKRRQEYSYRNLISIICRIFRGSGKTLGFIRKNYYAAVICFQLSVLLQNIVMPVRSWKFISWSSFITIRSYCFTMFQHLATVNIQVISIRGARYFTVYLKIQTARNGMTRLKISFLKIIWF